MKNKSVGIGIPKMLIQLSFVFLYFVIVILLISFSSCSSDQKDNVYHPTVESASLKHIKSFKDFPVKNSVVVKHNNEKLKKHINKVEKSKRNLDTLPPIKEFAVLTFVQYNY